MALSKLDVKKMGNLNSRVLILYLLVNSQINPASTPPPPLQTYTACDDHIDGSMILLTILLHTLQELDNDLT